MNMSWPYLSAVAAVFSDGYGVRRKAMGVMEATCWCRCDLLPHTCLPQRLVYFP
jgi:hypothetical protein